MRPSVTVVLTVYNAAWCVERAIDSVLAQTVPPSEIIICDDGSEDGTPDLIERRYGMRVTVRRLPHQNAAAARRYGLAEARGDWLAFLDADDWWQHDKLEQQLDYLQRHPEVKWLSTDGPYVSEAGIERESWLSDYFDPVRELNGDLFPVLLQRCFPLMSSMLVEHEAYDAVGGLDGSIVYSHDYDLWLRLASRYPGAVLAQKLVSYWTHPGALSKRYEMRYRDDLMLMQRIARGELRGEPELKAAASKRAASHAFDLGLMCLRSGRSAEGRAFLRQALGDGPAVRRAAAALGSVLPDGLVPLVKR
ncbi:MAG: glycosyltransferase, partial [Candidatus Eisenbacteria bacterium]